MSDLRERVARALSLAGFTPWWVSAHAGEVADALLPLIEADRDAAVAEAVKAEREACAKLADAEADKQGRIPISGAFGHKSAWDIAQAIRDRSAKP